MLICIPSHPNKATGRARKLGDLGRLIAMTAVFALGVFGQSPTPQPSPTNPPDANETILKYQEFLRDEAKQHRDYTQSYYDSIWKTLGVLGLLVTGVLAWMNWKTKSDIQNQVNARFKDTIQGLWDEKLKQIDRLLQENKDRSTRQFEEINRIILEITVKSTIVSVPGGGETRDLTKTDVEGLKGKRVLWVDDRPGNNDYLRKMLEQAGIVFTLALNTEEALTVMGEQEFDLIISDMGRGTEQTAGLGLLTSMKNRGLDIPCIIFTSSRAVSEYGDQARKLGVAEIISGNSGVLSAIQQQLLKK